MTIRRFSSRTDRLDRSFMAAHLQGARSYRRIAGYFTSSLFEIAHEWLESVPDVRIVCNVDLAPEDLKIAQLRETKMLGRWNERSIEAETLGEKMDQYIEQRRKATGFGLRYNDTVKPSEDVWRDCASVLARRDLDNLMRQGWSG
jgi:hypothetical protein